MLILLIHHGGPTPVKRWLPVLVLFPWLTVGAALYAWLTLAGGEGKQPVYDRPLGNCLEMSDLLRNRPYPPKHGVHSYAKPVPICETP